MRFTRFALPAAAALLTLTLAACSGGGAALSGGLTQRMDQPGANLNRGEALGILNHYRATVGAPALAADGGLDSTAQNLAAGYAKGTQPKLPAGAIAMRLSAGYANFAETFSGWRNSPEDAKALGNASASRAGIGVAYDANSAYGVYWVLLLAN